MKIKNKPILYYADGYHAGLFLRSEEDLASQLEQIFTSLDSNPAWKVNLEIEAYALIELSTRRPELIDRCHIYLNEGRMEIVNGSYAQPYPSVISGESMIRQLLTGKKIVQELLCHEVVTYAVQEPCWGSQLPQLLCGLGYRYCVLRNHFTYFGEPPGTIEEKVWWIGPDGSRVESVPSYACFERKPFNDPGVRSGQDFANTALKNGIKNPIGFFMEDIGGAPSSHVDSCPNNIKLVIWKEYFKKTHKPTVNWRITQEDFIFSIQWGTNKLVQIAQNCRKTEINILNAEKTAFAASFLYMMEYPSRSLGKAWEFLMMSQHHDPWVCSEARMGDFAAHPYWYWVDKWTGKADKILEEVSHKALSAILKQSKWENDGLPVSVAVVNTLIQEREDAVIIKLPSPLIKESLKVIDVHGEDIPSQITNDGDELLFPAHVPSFGYSLYYLVPSDSAANESEACITEEDDSLSVQTPLLSVVFDKIHGGCIRSLYDKESGKEFVDLTKGYWGDFIGYLTDLGRWEKGSSERAEVKVIENGPVMTQVKVKGKFHSASYLLDVIVYQKSKCIDFHACFDFGLGITVGDPYKSASWTDTRQSWHNDEKKLQVQFPLALQGASISKNSAFDVTCSHFEEVFHNNWYDIKNNVIQDWLDISDGEYGAALYADFTTGYGFSKTKPLSIILGWNNLIGKSFYSYGVSFHKGNWLHENVPLTCLRRSNPLLVTGLAPGKEMGKTPRSRSWIDVNSPNVELSAAYMYEGKFFIRLFNNLNRKNSVMVNLHFKVQEDVLLTRLDGETIENVEMEKTMEGCSLQLQMNPFGLTTVCLSKII